MTRPATIRECAHCGEDFEARQEYSNFKRKYCSFRCSGASQRKRARESWPPKPEVERLYATEGATDASIGKRYGKSYEWARRLRKHYGIDAPKRRGKPEEEKSDRLRWGIGLKPEAVCRCCNKRPARALNLHHAIPRSMCRAARYDLRNGLPLCERCHMGWHHREVVVYRDAFTREEWAYLLSVELAGGAADRAVARQAIPGSWSAVS